MRQPHTDPHPRLTRLAPALALALALIGCAPPQAGVAISERARLAPPPELVVTDAFGAPGQEGARAAARLGAGIDVLAARAADLRRRGSALSGADVVDPDARARLEAARPD